MSLILDGTNGLSDVDGSAATPAIRGTDANTGIFFPAADTIAFSEGGTESMRIDGSGNLGIGVTSPTAKLEVNASATDLISIVSTNTNNSGSNATSNSLKLGITNSARQVFVGIKAQEEAIDANETAMVFSTTNSGASYLERMRIDSAGNVGIGTSSPTVRLSVSNSAGGNVANFTNTSSADLNINLTAGVTLLTPSTGTLALGTSNTERMRIDSSGNLLVGGTTQGTATGAVYAGNTLRAWARFTGATATIAASFNVSSITRTSAGVYAANFTNALPQSNFVITGSANGNQALFYNDGTASTTSAPFRTAAGGTNFDYSSIEFMVVA